MFDLAHVVHHAVVWAQTTPSPAPKPTTSSSDNGNLASLAALIASMTGLVTAIGAIILGLHKRDQSNPMADKAIEYLIKQNKELLKERVQGEDPPPKTSRRKST